LMARFFRGVGVGLLRPRVFSVAALAGFLLTGCALKQQPLAEGALAKQAAESFEMLDAEQTPVSVPLSLAEAISRALKYNLELRGKLLEQSLAAGELEAGNFDMLPKLVADAGYSWRSNELSRLSSSNLDPDNAVFSVAREHADGDLAFQWNLLDFGASYYTAKQNGDRLLIANERRRKAMHTLVQNVRTAYWRAYAAQLLDKRVEEAIAEAEAALRDAEKASDERVRDPVAALRYQRTLLENLRLLEAVQQELSTGIVELSQYIGRKPGQPLRLAVDRLPSPAALEISLEAMEVTALVRNADLRESVYEARIAALEARKALIGLLPGISFDYGYNFDDDRYLVNDEWYSAGTRVSYNLLTLLSAPERMRNAKKRAEIKESQRLALQMAVVTQVHLARHQYDEARKQYERAEAIYEIDKELSELYRNRAAAEMVSRMDRISADVTFILSTARLYQALSRSQEAASRVEATLGLEPVIDSVGEQTLEQIQAVVEEHLDSWAPALKPEEKLGGDPVRRAG
jgi:outer membrane protein TolC